jgi:glutathione S-transferase
MYKIAGSLRSPFVRTCRLFMLANGLPHEFHRLDFVDDAQAAAEVARETPINKVPYLIDGDKKIFDSRVIINYLVKKHGLPALTLDEENIVSSIYSCLDTGVILFLMRKDGFNMDDPGFFLSRMRRRIPENLKYLTPWVTKLDPAKHWNYPAMALYSFLYWAKARDIANLNDTPEMTEFLERFQNAPGVKETGF